MNPDIFLWLEASPARYGTAACLFAGLFLAGALRPWLPDARQSPVARWLWGAAFWAGMVGTLLVFRWPSVLVPVEINSDESIALVGAGLIRAGSWPWRDFDPTTSGVVNLLPLCPVAGLPSGFLLMGGRLAGLVLILGTLAALFRMVRLLAGAAAARLVLVPPLLFYATATTPDFIHNNSEQMSVLLGTLAGALLAAAAVSESARPVKALLAGLLLGMMPFAKLQSAPIAAAIAGAGALMFVRRRRRSGACRCELAAFIIGGALFPLGLTAWLHMEGCLDRLLLGYFSYAIHMVEGGSLMARCGPSQLLSAREWVYHACGQGALIITGLAAWAALRRGRMPPHAAGLLVAAGGIALAAAHAILLPGTNNLHYLVFSIIPLAVPPAALLGCWDPSRGGGARFPWIPAALFLSVALAGPVKHYLVDPPEFRYLGHTARPPWQLTVGRGWFKSFLEAKPSAVMERAKAVVHPGERVAIWGWAPSLFLATGTLPATQDIQTIGQIDPSGPREAFRRRYLEDFLRAAPPVLAEAVGPDAILFKDRGSQGVRSFPELQRLVDAHYRLVLDSPSLRIYRRR